MSSNDKKVHISMPIPVIVVMVVLIEIFAVAGIKKVDAKNIVENNGKQYEYESVAEDREEATDDDGDEGTTEISNKTENIDDKDLKYKEGLVHKDKKIWKKPDVCTDMSQYAKVINQYILSGSNEQLIIDTKGIDDEEITNINEYITQPFGWCDRHIFEESDVDGMNKVEVYIHFEPVYYVYRYIVYGDDIPETEEKAIELLKAVETMLFDVDLTTMSDYEKELFFYEYIINTADYDYSALEATERNDAHSAYGLFVNHKAVCEGYARAMGLLMSIAGIDNYYVTGVVREELRYGDEDGDHAWNMAKIDGKWYLLDATWDDQGSSEMTHKYFNINDKIMSQTREAAHIELYPECNSMDMNYFVYNNRFFESYDDYKEYIASFAGKTEKNEIEAVVSDYSEEKYDFSEISSMLGTGGISFLVDTISDDYTQIVIYIN